ncbi:MAG: c-type cytochrome [Bacteroidota bacterium]|nr:c-type cytochrome [Bacteroidota bacterium]
MKKQLLVIVTMTIVVFSAVAFTSPKDDDKGFKNLKVLPKDIDHDKLIKVMREFNDALGVRCDFCHAPSKDPNEKHPDFASDDKPEKNIARSMMKMTSKINKKFFEQKHVVFGEPETMEISCATCHHGQPHPEKMHAGEHQGPPPAPKEEKH